VIVREALVSDPRVVAADASAREVAELLIRPNVRSALVVDAGRLVGCVTTDSIVAALARGEDVTALRARDLIEDEVTTIGPDAPLEEALRIMAERDLDRLPVIENGELLGVLPREPVVRRLMEDGSTELSEDYGADAPR
jgi:predicted transcriptional regulator